MGCSCQKGPQCGCQSEPGPPCAYGCEQISAATVRTGGDPQSILQASSADGLPTDGGLPPPAGIPGNRRGLAKAQAWAHRFASLRRSAQASGVQSRSILEARASQTHRSESGNNGSSESTCGNGARVFPQKLVPRQGGFPGHSATHGGAGTAGTSHKLELLVPGIVGSLSLDQANIMRSLAGVARQLRASRQHAPTVLRAGRGVGAREGDEKPQGLLVPWGESMSSPFDSKPKELLVAAPGLSAVVYSSDGTPTVYYKEGSLIRADYRSGTLYLEPRFVARHFSELATGGNPPDGTSRGGVSAPDIVMDYVWPAYRSRAASAPGTADAGALIGCWMLPSEGHSDVPTGTFWLEGAGAPLAHHYLVVDVAYTYHPQIKLHNGGTLGTALSNGWRWCAGFSDFVADVLSNRPATLLDYWAAEPTPVGTCDDIKVLVVNREPYSEFGGTWEVGCHELPYPTLTSDRSGPCSSPPDYVFGSDSEGRIVDGVPWDYGSITLWDPYGNYPWYFSPQFRSMSAPWPSDPSAPFAAIASFNARSFTVPPSRLRFDGFVLDALLTVCRLSFDQARRFDPIDFLNDPYVGAAASEVGARTFGKFGLAIVADLAALYVHELGHVYLGGNSHCGFLTLQKAFSSNNPHAGSYTARELGSPRWSNCWEIAAQNMQAWIIAENGLPQDPYLGINASNGVSEWPHVTPSGAPWAWDYYSSRWKGVSGAPYYANRHSVLGTVSNCERVYEGAQGGDYDPDTYDAGELMLCDNIVTRQIGSPDTYHSGYSITSTPGCSCSWIPSTAAAPDTPPDRPGTSYCNLWAGLADPALRTLSYLST